MGKVDQEETARTSTLFAKKNEKLSAAMERTSDWIFSQEIPSDVTVHVGEVSFSLHQYPLVSKSGYIRKLVSGASDADVCDIEVHDIPGGAEAFELASNFCYGINFEISIENISMLRCAAEYLEMTEDYTAGNLVSRTESYLNDIALKSLSGAVTVLHLAENLIPMAEKIKLVSRCIDTIVHMACKDNQFSLLGKTENSHENVNASSVAQPNPIVHWWSEDLTVLRIDIFQQVITTMMTKGFKQYELGPILMLYAQKSFRGLDIFGKGRKKIEPRQKHEKRVVLETIVALLPGEKNTMSVSFLSMLLRASIFLETTVACRLNLEKKIGEQLEQAVLDDLLIRSYSFTGDTLFDVDTVQHIMMNYLEYGMDGTGFDDECVSPLPSGMERVGKLMESYLAEVASDRNLTVSRFISLAELLPEQSKKTEDGIYRAVDIYLKAHPTLSDMERKKVCSLMDCQKLSRGACAHAAQNERLPVQTVVQVLYYEQQRLREGMGGESAAPPHKVNIYSADNHQPSDELSRLRKENDQLNLELAKVKMRLKEYERQTGGDSTSAMSTPPQSSSNKPPLPRKSFINTVSKKLGLVRADVLKPPGRTRPNKDRRRSVS
ncbi:hypothetical protein MKX01_023640 [Papaver californicum]|nr:hypothetical protein MKX01_023640 [Papaver californicum]